MSPAELKKYRAAMKRAAETFDSIASEIAAGTRPLDDALAPAANVVTVAEAFTRKAARKRAA